MLRFVAIALAGAAAACVFVACSSDDDDTAPILLDASQPPPTKIEAGAPCATNNDCASGLACLYPTTSCQAFKVCAPPIDNCASPQPACSCLAETVQTCNGYATDPIDYAGACNDSGAPPPQDAGNIVDQTAPPIDAPADSNGGGGEDAADSAGE